MNQNGHDVNRINADTPPLIRRIYTELRGRREIKYRDTLVAMALHCNKHNRCFPSISTLAADCGIGYAGMQRRLKALEEMGLILTISRSEKNGRQTSNGYVVLPRKYTCLPSPAGEPHTERTKPTPVGGTSENAKSASGTTEAESSQAQHPDDLSLACQEEIWHVASTWRWWFPRQAVVPVEGEPRPVGTTTVVVENARETLGSSFLESLFGTSGDDLPDGEVA